ncbi:MAG: hypothetical protein KDB40_24375 [Acidimicrobiales bacterium]|nr:hypothetical protein [Acidimicrobiales bacterium]MCB9392558.1 hypothetical protein [Acidimicrobiaceae bacterium]
MGVTAAEPSRPRRIAVAITTHTVDLGPHERVSLERVIEVLSPAHDLYLVVPASLDVTATLDRYPALRHLPMGDEFFGGRRAHNRLLLASTFYERFAGYEFMMVHHLDAYVFRDEIDAWCDAGYDFLGAPWIPHDGMSLSGVGNGGLSLRRVASFLRVVRMLEAPPTSAAGRLARRLPYRARAALRIALTPVAARIRGGQARSEALLGYLNRGFDAGEDYFWGLRVAPWQPWFRVAPVDDAVPFAFDLEPARLYEMNGGVLPMACHGWPASLDFWGRFIDVPAGS